MTDLTSPPPPPAAPVAAGGRSWPATPTPEGAADRARPAPERSGAEMRVRRILCVPDCRTSATRNQAERLFSVSILLSASRCLLTYVAIPVLGPILGSSLSDNPWIGGALAILALVFDVRAVRRFWMADHPWRWRMTVVYLVVAAMVLGLLALDVTRLTS
jgi:hypothetical protein